MNPERFGGLRYKAFAALMALAIVGYYTLGNPQLAHAPAEPTPATWTYTPEPSSSQEQARSVINTPRPTGTARPTILPTRTPSPTPTIEPTPTFALPEMQRNIDYSLGNISFELPFTLTFSTDSPFFQGSAEDLVIPVQPLPVYTDDWTAEQAGEKSPSEIFARYFENPHYAVVVGADIPFHNFLLVHSGIYRDTFGVSHSLPYQWLNQPEADLSLLIGTPLTVTQTRDDRSFLETLRVVDVSVVSEAVVVDADAFYPNDGRPLFFQTDGNGLGLPDVARQSHQLTILTCLGGLPGQGANTRFPNRVLLTAERIAP